MTGHWLSRYPRLMARVLLVTNDYPPDRGGIQTYLRELVDRTSHEVRVLAPFNPDAPPDPRVVRHPRWRFMFPTPRVRRWIFDQAEGWGPDVILYGAPHPPALLGPSIGRRSGLPYVVLCHGAETTLAAVIPGLRRALRRSLRGAGHRLAVSEFTAARVHRLTGLPCERLGVGVTVEHGVLAAPEGGEDVICVSRFVPRKGQDRLVDALARLDNWNGRLMLIGSGRRAAAVQRRARRKRVPVILEQGLDDVEVAERLAAAAIFAMPCRSRWFGLEVEGLGIVFLEAAARGLPVVAGRSGGAPETILPGTSGFLAESSSELAEALGILLDDPGLRAAMGRAGRSLVERAYKWDDVIDRLDAAIAELALGDRSS